MGRFQNEDGKQYIAIENFSQDDFHGFNDEIYRKSFPPLCHLYDNVERVMLMTTHPIHVPRCQKIY